MSKKLVNKFYDISKFPASSGMLVFYISPSKVLNNQSAQQCFDYMKHFSFEGDGKIVEPEVGLNTIYADTLYMYSEKPAAGLKNNLLAKVVNHRNEFLNILKDNPQFIKKAFNFLTWNQALFSSDSFFDYFGQIKNFYKKDKKFQEYIQKDYEEIGQREGLDEYQLNFFLEEITLFYLISKKKVKLHNDFLQGKEKWVLNCYPRKPLWSQIYLYQQNPLSLKVEDNRYENSYYDLDAKILYDFDRLDLETYEIG